MSNQKLRPIFDTLVEYGRNKNIVAFDVPGHKQGNGISKDFKEVVGEEIFRLDVNSMKELDILSHPTGIISEAEKLAAHLYGADEAYFLVNGSTSGVQNMILATCGENDKLILPRNVHKSVINGLVLSGALPVYIQPDIDPNIGISMGVTLESVKSTIDENPDAKAILLLNPTYFGFTSNLKAIIEYAHKKGLLVLVDESHGSHFGLHKEFPSSSIKLGADLATISMHKTGGSLTQSSILLLNTNRVSKNKVRSAINLMQTSSASYLLLASLDMARYELANNKDLLDNVYQVSKYASDKLKKLDFIDLVDHTYLDKDSRYQKDISKLVIDVRKLGITGFEVYDIMKEKYNIQLELGETHVVLAVISLGDTIENIDKLVEAFIDLSKSIKPSSHKTIHIIKAKPQVLYSPRKAFFMDSEYINLEESLHRIAADQIMIYPPGIPLVVPGEIITDTVIENYKSLIQYGNQTVGSIMNGQVKIKVIKEV